MTVMLALAFARAGHAPLWTPCSHPSDSAEVPGPGRYALREQALSAAKLLRSRPAAGVGA